MVAKFINNCDTYSSRRMQSFHADEGLWCWRIVSCT